MLDGIYKQAYSNPVSAVIFGSFCHLPHFELFTLNDLKLYNFVYSSCFGISVFPVLLLSFCQDLAEVSNYGESPKASILHSIPQIFDLETCVLLEHVNVVLRWFSYVGYRKNFTECLMTSIPTRPLYCLMLDILCKKVVLFSWFVVTFQS